MSNNYYAGNVIYNNQHKELTIQGNLSAQQMMKRPILDFCSGIGRFFVPLSQKCDYT